MWPFRKKKQKLQITDETEPLLLHGVDLNKWNYLGLSPISWGSHKGRVFFFSKKGSNEKIRKCVIVGFEPSSRSFIEKNHLFVIDQLSRWKVCEYSFYRPISEPSEYMKKVMLSDGFVWDKDKDWWKVATETELYENAVDNQKEKVVSSVEENVLHVDFGKKK